MAEHVPSLPVSVDPLIAEARRRTRRRRVLAMLAVALVLAVATSWLALRSTGGPATAPSAAGGPIAVIRPIESVGTGGGVAWAIDPHGLIWITHDGGRTWRFSFRRSYGPSVEFVDKRHGWILTALDNSGALTLERTLDGGRTWRISSLPGGFRDAGMPSFYDARHGYVLAADASANGTQRLFSTDDGGASWRFVARLPQPHWGSITFVNRRAGFLYIPSGPTTSGNGATGGCGPTGRTGPTGGNGPVGCPQQQTWPDAYYRTTDGGKTWSKLRVPSNTGLFSSFGSDLLAVDRKWSRIYESRDGGTHWNARVLPNGVKSGRNFALASPKMWTFVAGNTLNVTTDGGKSWDTFVPRGLPQPLETIGLAFSSPRIGLTLVWRPWGALYRTTDGGRHWTPSACSRAHLACPAGSHYRRARIKS